MNDKFGSEGWVRDRLYAVTGLGTCIHTKTSTKKVFLDNEIRTDCDCNVVSEIWIKDRCLNNNAIVWKYMDYEKKYRGVSARCKDCFSCMLHYSGKITAKSMSKFENLVPKPKRVYLWTFGTSLEEGYVYAGEHYRENTMDILARFWRLFTQRMAMKSKRNKIVYKPLFRVFEAGSKGRRLHVHAIFEDYFDHSTGVSIDEHGKKITCEKSCLHAWCTWVAITGEKSNVNFVSKPQYANPVKAFYYCAKYASKNGSKYSYMGRMLKVPFGKYDPSAKIQKAEERLKLYRSLEDVT